MAPHGVRRRQWEGSPTKASTGSGAARDGTSPKKRVVAGGTCGQSASCRWPTRSASRPPRVADGRHRRARRSRLDPAGSSSQEARRDIFDFSVRPQTHPATWTLARPILAGGASRSTDISGGEGPPGRPRIASTRYPERPRRLRDSQAPGRGSSADRPAGSSLGLMAARRTSPRPSSAARRRLVRTCPIHTAS